MWTWELYSMNERKKEPQIPHLSQDHLTEDEWKSSNQVWANAWYLSGLIFLGQSMASMAMEIPLKVIELKSSLNIFTTLNQNQTKLCKIITEPSRIQDTFSLILVHRQQNENTVFNSITFNDTLRYTSNLRKDSRICKG